MLASWWVELQGDFDDPYVVSVFWFSCTSPSGLCSCRDDGRNVTKKQPTQHETLFNRVRVRAHSCVSVAAIASAWGHGWVFFPYSCFLHLSDCFDKYRLLA